MPGVYKEGGPCGWSKVIEQERVRDQFRKVMEGYIVQSLQVFVKTLDLSKMGSH